MVGGKVSEEYRLNKLEGKVAMQRVTIESFGDFLIASIMNTNSVR